MDDELANLADRHTLCDQNDSSWPACDQAPYDEYINWPLRLPKMFVQISFKSIKDYFQIFPEDKAKVSLYLEGTTDPQSVVISPLNWVAPICEPERVADEIECNNLNVYCKDPSDVVVLRIVGAGEILMHDTSTCADIIADQFDYA